MLYYIVPPLIIIIGLAVLVSFLFRKVNQIPRSELSFLDQSGKGRRKFFGDGFWKKLTQLALKILEKLIQRFKLYSLKFHNCCQNWFQSIKKKREKQTRFESIPPGLGETGESRRAGKEESAAAAEKKEEIKPEVISEARRVSQTGIARTEEIKTLPMVSKKVVLPEQQVVVKDRLEEALIERITSNPSDIEAYERLGDYYIEQGNYGEALECFRHVLKLSPVHRKAKIRVKRLEKMPEK